MGIFGTQYGYEDSEGVSPTEREYDFRRSCDLCAHEDCNVVWINTCAALIKGKEANFQDIDYVRKRISRNEDEAQMLYKMAICEGAFKGECAHDCIYYETIQGV